VLQVATLAAKAPVVKPSTLTESGKSIVAFTYRTKNAHFRARNAAEPLLTPRTSVAIWQEDIN
jgi:hypothetical protein